MLEKVWKAITEYEMFPEGASIVVGVSGGVDSIALLHLLWRLRQKRQWQLLAVHIHHGLRGTEADQDAAFVEAFCAEKDIFCVVKKIDIRAEAKKCGLGEEEAGRMFRYAVFRELAGENGRIAVAHHRKDQAETLLMRLCRGTGMTGLAGMLPVRENICRPLLFCSREEIEAYCRAEGLLWREDATNQQAVYTRNKVRLQVLPLLKQINPKAEEHIARTASLLAMEEDYLEQQAALCEQAVRLNAPTGEVRLSCPRLAALHPAMRRRVLRRAMQAFLQTEPSFIQLTALEELLKKENGKRRDFADGLCAEIRYDALVLFRKNAEEKNQKKETTKKQKGFCFMLPPEGEGEIAEAGLYYRIWQSEEPVEISQDICTNVFDYDKIEQRLFCRTRRAGDVIRLKAGRKKIKDVFIDEKIPKEERERVPLIAAEQEILWIPGVRRSIAGLVDETTKRFLYIQIRRVQKWKL